MKRSLKRLLSLLLVFTMVASLSMTGWAVNDPGDTEPAAQTSDGTELEMEDLDPGTLHVHKLGEIDEDELEVPEEASLISADETVRVSIFLDSPATLDAGYSVQGVGTNSAAISYRDSLKREQASVTAAIEKVIGGTLDVKWNLTLAVNAISANVRHGDIPKISQVSGVKSVVLENQYEAQVDQVAQPNTANTSSGMVGATTAWASGYTGAGSRIAIIDTGIDTSHQSFAEDPFNYSVGLAGATSELMTKQQVQNLASQLNSKSGNYVSAKIPYGYNYVDKNTTITHLNDTQGEHGSHVAGIAAANRYIKSGSSYLDAAENVKAVGMAPDAQLFVMKVFGAGGGAYDSDYMVAIEDAIILDCDVVNLSLGSSVQGWTFDNGYQDILNNLVNKEHNEGMVVSISAGNSYDLTQFLKTDLYIDDVSMHTGGSPGTFVNSLGVAAAENIGSTGTPLTFNGNQTVYYNETSSSGAAMSSIAGSYSYVYIDAAGAATDYSTVNSAVSLSGKIVIVNRGELSFYEKGNNAISYSPKALIVANNEAGSISMSLDDYTGTFPMVSITLADAETIKANSTKGTTGGITYYTGTVTVTNTVASDTTGSREDAEITDFSSWGVPGSLLMKPEITAPGGDIYSVFGTNKTSSGTTGGSDQYELMSGTSMAAPHVTGLSAVAAEYLRENPISGRNEALANDYSTRAIIQSLLMSTATPMQNDGAYLPVLQQGAGLIEVSKAVEASSVLMMDDAGLTTKTGAAADGKVKVELGDDPAKAGEYTYSFTLYNLTDTDLEFKLSSEFFTQDSYVKDGETFMAHTTTPLAITDSYVWAPVDSEAVGHDVNKDGNTDAADAQAVLDYLAGNVSGDGLDLAAGEMDNDGELTTYDAHLLLNDMEESGGIGDGVVPAHGQRSVTVTVKLDHVDDVYTSGAYIEGFTYAECVTTTDEGVSYEHTHSIPVLGFYGSWTDPSMFDNTSYVDTLYGTAKTPYTDNTNTNYMTVNYNGSTVKYTGNPYMVEETFPADRLALSSNTTIQNFAYNLYRAAGTTGFAVSKLDGIDGNVTDVKAANVVGNEVSGIWYYQSGGTWQNTGTKFYSANKSVSSYGLSEGDTFRVGFYAIPEYNAMLVNDSYNEADSGILGSAGFTQLLKDNTLGRGAFVGYDFTVDDTDPVIGTAALSGSDLTVSATDNLNLAYVAVLSLDGETVYAEAAPGSDAYSITFDASDAIANAAGYVAVFAADYAGNEVAKAVKVNDRSYDEKTVYVLTSTLTAGNEYLIVSRNSTGSGYALGHSGTTVATNAVTVKAADGNVSSPYIDSKDVAETSVWTAYSGIKLMNGSYYLRRSTQNALQLSTTNSNNSWTWDGANNRLSINSRYLRYASNTFSLNTSAGSVYLYQKTVIRTAVDPYGVTSVTVTPDALDLYKGNTADLTAKVLPLTAEDRGVTWSSSNTSVATVDESGHVVAVGAGTATITATANGDSTKSASCTVSVTSVDKTLNGIVWDEEGGVYFSSFNANSLPTWTKLHSDAKGMELQSAFMQSTSNLYAATLDTSASESVLYSVNRSSYALTEFGTNYVMAFGMAPASTRYTDYFVYGFAKYLIFGNLTPVEDDDAGGTFSGIPYGLLDLSSTDVGDAYVCAVAAKTVGSTSSSYYFLDENGVIWQTTMSISSSVSFGTPTKVVETGIGTSFLYQTLYYDGTYLYWGHQADNIAELIIINPSTGAVYHAGDFGEGVWPATGFYVDGKVAPASVDEEEPMDLGDLTPVATRDELMTADVQARLAVETPEPVSFGSLNAIGSANLPAVRSSGTQAVGESVSDADEGVTITVTENEDSTNGFFTVTYDPDKLTYVGTDSDLAYKAVNDTESGTIKFAYADKEAIPAGTALAAIRFETASEDTEVAIHTTERNTDLSLDESEVIPVSGIVEFAITEQPVDAVGAPGQTVTFSLTATGKGLTYQWEYCNAGKTKWQKSTRTGATTDTLTIPVTVAREGQKYRCVVTDVNGNVLISDEVTISLNLKIITHPADFYGEPGQKASFTVEAEGDGLTYQWQYLNVGTTKWKNSTQSGSQTETITVPITTARFGQQYRCVVTNSEGYQVTSEPATLNQKEINLRIVTQPEDSYGKVGGSATFTVEAEGDGLTYQWQYLNVGKTNWANSSQTGCNTPSLTVPITAARFGQQYRCVVTDSTGHKVTSEAAAILESHYGADPVIITQPVSVVGQVGEQAVFTVEAEGDELTYQWQYCNAGSSNWKNSTMAGCDTPTLTVKLTSARNGQQYRCVITDCNENTVITDVVTITIGAANH